MARTMPKTAAEYERYKREREQEGRSIASPNATPYGAPEQAERKKTTYKASTMPKTMDEYRQYKEYKQNQQKKDWYRQQTVDKWKDRFDLRHQRDDLTSAGASDADWNSYYVNQAKYGLKYGDEKSYMDALNRVTGYYDKQLSGQNHYVPAMTKEQVINYTGKRYAEQAPVYEQMARDAAALGDKDLYDRAKKGYDDLAGNYSSAYAAYIQAMNDDYKQRMGDLEKSDKGRYLYQTTSKEDVNRRVKDLKTRQEELKTQMEEADLERRSMRNNPDLIWYDDRGRFEDNEAYREYDRVSGLYGELQAEEERLEQELAPYQRAKDLYDYDDYLALREQLSPGGGMTQNEWQRLRDEGERKYRAVHERADKEKQEAKQGVGDTLLSGLSAYHALKMEKKMTEIEEDAGVVHDLEEARHLNTNDADIFFVLYAQDPEKAAEFIHTAKLQRDDEFQQHIADSIKDNPYLRWTAGMQGGAVAHLIGGAANLLDPYSETALEINRLGNALSMGAAQGAEEHGIFNTGALAGKIDENIPVIGDILGGKGLGDAYQLGTSMVESGLTAAAAAAVGDYGDAVVKVVEFLGTAIMGSSAAASDYDECIKRGLDRQQAMTHATAAGIAEAAFEYISLDKLVNQDITRGFVKNFFLQGGIEASEEACTTIANRITDAMLAREMGFDNSIEQRVKELMALGVDRKEAEDKAEREWLAEVINDALGGFISGGFMTLGNTAMNWREYKAAREQNRMEGQMTRQSGQTDALRKYAEANDLGWYGRENDAEAVKSGVGPVQNVETGERIATPPSEARNDSQKQTRQEKRQERQQKREQKRQLREQTKQDRQIGSDTQRVQQHLNERFAGKTVEEQTALRDKLVEQYGNGIAPAVYEAISVEAAKKAASLKSADEIRAARDQAVNETQDLAMKRAIADGYDQAVFGQAMRSGNADEAGRYFQQLRNTGEGGMTLEATVKDQDGQSRQIAITGMTEDGKGVKLADGTTVAVSKLRADADTMDAVQRISEMEMGTDADAVLQAYIKADKKGVDGYRWLMDYSLAYEQGRTNKLSLEEAVKRSSLDRQTVMEAYTLGQREAHQSTKDAVETLKKMPKKEGITGKTSNIDTSEIEGVTLNESEREQFELANKIFSLIGVDVKWVASAVKNGRFVGANGSYLNGVVTLDVHAGRNFLEQINSGILTTTGHELTHFLQQYAPEQYRALKEFLFRQIVQSSANGETRLERLIWEKQRRASSKLSRKAAEDEVVADACQTMLRDSKAIREFAQQDEEAAKGVVRWLDKWFGKLKQAFSRSAQLTEEARFVDGLAKEVREAFGKLWDEALREAVETHDRVGNIQRAVAREANEIGASQQMVEDALTQHSDRIDEKTLENQDIRYSERDELASDNRVHDITNRNGDTVGIQDGNGHLQFSQRTWRESGKEKMQEYLDERVRKYEANRNDPEGMHPDDAKALMDAVQEQYDALDEIVRQQPGNYKTYEEWADAEVETDIFGNPVFSWLKANGDYGISGDASLICVKRRTLDAVFDYMIRENMIQDGPEGLKLAQESIVAINDIIRAHGFETACSTCYIDARRYRAAIVAGSFCNVYNKLVRSMLKGKTGVPINAFNFGGNKSVTPLANSLDTLSDSEINWDGINKAIRDQEAKWESKGWEKFTEDGEEKWRRNGTVKNLPTSGTTEYRIALALKEKPSLRKLALRSDFLSGNGFLELNRTNKDILTLYNVKKGQAGPKATETDIQYLHEALENSFITPDRMFKAGGFRLQSFSDYVPRLVFDYVEIIGDLAAKGVPAHMYTKEILCVLQHGLTGTKINMSLIPAMVKKGIAPGLDADGNYLWRDGQTFGSTAYSLSPKLEAHLSKILGYQVKGRLTGAQGFELAKLIQNDPAYGKNNGTIAIGVSEAQIRKMLDDADIRMVIPYHKSGLNHILASMMEIPGFENYESYQNTLKWNGTKWAKVDVDFDFNEAVQKHKGDARAAAQDYLDWCEENGYKPKFSGVASGSARNSYNKAYDFTQHADWQTGTMTGEAESNYYKVLADFTCYDAEGKVSRQEAVKLNYPGTDSAFGSMKQLIEMGLESDAMLQAKQDAEVPKIVADIVREIPKFEAAGRNMKAYAQLKENVEGRQYSERDYDIPSDLELMDRAIEGLSEAGGEEYWKALMESDPGLAEDVKGYKDQAKKLAAAEKRLADYKKQMQLGGNRKLNTTGIPSLALKMMKDLGASDAKGRGVAKQVTQTLTAAYQKALDSIDKGMDDSSAFEIVYNEGVVPAAEIIAKHGTHSEKTGRGWITTSLESYYGEGGLQSIIDTVAGYVGADYALNRYRKAIQPTVADRIVERTEKRMQKQVDAATERATEAERINKKLTEDRDFWKNQQAKDSETVTFLNERLKEARQDLRDNKSLSSQERRKLAARINSLQTQLQAKREEIRALKSLSQQLDKQAVEFGQKQAKLLDKLEQQVQRERDILAGKLKPLGMQRLLKAEREKAAAKAEQHKDEVFANYKERKSQTALRGRIKNLHDEMRRDLLKPREGHFVPQTLIRPVVDLLDMVNTTQDQTLARRLEDLEQKIQNAKTDEQRQALEDQKTGLLERIGRLDNKIAAISAAYDAIKKDERYSEFYDETVKDMLVELGQTLAGRSIYELNSDELADVYTVMKAMRTTIRNTIKADLVEKGKEAWEIGNQLRQELRNGKGASPELLEKYHMAMLSAKRAFNRFGGYLPDSAWNKVYQMLDNAQLKMLNLDMEATKIFDPVMNGKENLKRAAALNSYKEKDLVDVGLKDADGNAVKITRGMMLALYMHLQNEENMRHAMYGGLTLPDYKRYYNNSGEAWGRGTVEIPALGAKVSNLEALLEEHGEAWVDKKYKEYKAEIRKTFESIRQNIEKELTDYDRQWIECAKEFFDDFSRRELNAVTNSMYGFSKAKVDNYFPIVTDKNFLKSEFDSVSKNISLENAGFMKERVKAGNPILLEDLTRAVIRQKDNVSRYAGLTEALKTFGNVYNTQTKGFTDSVKKAMAKTYGKNGQQYIENLITDMIGGRTTPGSLFDKIKGNYAQAVLSANLSVTIKQAASYPTAAATVGWAPIMKALFKGGRKGRVFSRADTELINTYSPLLYYRSKGSIDTEIGELPHAKDWTKKAKWLMGWIQGMDKATVGRLWYAAEYYVKDNFNLEKGTAEQIKNGESPFYQKVAEVFNTIVEDTQPNYTVLQRPDILRNPNKLVRAMTMFSTQRFQNANILIDSVNEYAAMVRYDKKNGTQESKAARKAAKTKLTNAISSQVVSAVVLTAMTLFANMAMHRMNPWRDDDDELTQASIMEEFLDSFLSTMAGSFLGGSELYEAISSILTGSKYYGNDVGGISTINDFATAVVNFGQKAVKLIGDEESKPEDWTKLAETQLAKVGEYLAQMTGVPIANINKIISGGKNHIIDAINGEFFSFEAGVERSNKANARRLIGALESGDTAKANDVLKDLSDPDKRSRAVTAYLKELFLKDEISESKTITYLTQFVQTSEDGKKRPITEDEAYWKIREWEAIQDHKGEEGYKWSQYEDLRVIMDSKGDISSEVQRLTDHSVKDTSVNNEVKDYIKKLYTTGMITEDEAIAMLQKYHQTKDDKTKQYRADTADEAWMTVQEWAANNEHADDEDYSWTKYEDLYEAMDAGRSIASAWKELSSHGISDDTLKEAVGKHISTLFRDKQITESKAIQMLQKYKGLDEDEAYWEVDKWRSKTAAEDAGEEFTDTNYRDLYAAIDGNKDAKAAVKELTDHGYKERDIYSAAQAYLTKRYEDGKINETQFKNQLSRYARVTKTDEVNDIVNKAKCFKETGYRLSNLNTSYLDGEISADKFKQIQKKYGGMSDADAKKRVRWLDLKKAKPDLDVTESQANTWYDGSKKSQENRHESAQSAGMSIERYLEVRRILDEIKDTSGNRTGEDEFIEALSKMNLKPREKAALYYERYKGTTKYSKNNW